MTNRPIAPTANRQQRRLLDRLAREHAGRVIVRAAASQTLAVLLVDARSGLSTHHTITRGGFLA